MQRRRLPVIVFERQHDFRHVARRACRGARENHIVHARCAHVLVGVLAHHPAQRLQQIGFAAAIWPDNACQAGFDIKLGRFHKRFEPRKSEPGKLHIAPNPSILPASSQQRINLLQVFDCPCALIFFAIDEESRNPRNPKALGLLAHVQNALGDVSFFRQASKLSARSRPVVQF